LLRTIRWVLREASLRQLAALLLDGGLVARRLVQALALVVVRVSAQQAVVAPGLHGRRGDVELERDLGERQHPRIAQSIVSRLELIRLPYARHDVMVE